MTDLQTWQEKIIAVRRHTSFRDFFKEIASWRPMLFYKNQSMISRYPTTDRIGTLLSSEEYESQRDTLVDTTGIDYDSSKDFFAQWQQLFLSIPQDALMQMGSGENTDYADVVWGSKNVYLSNFIVYDCENICYSFVTRENCTNVFNAIMVFDNSQNVYMSAGVIKGYNIFYSKYISNCADVWFSKNLLGCQHCIRCHDLENMSYCIDNQQYSKEEYMEKKQVLLSQKSQFMKRFTGLHGSGANFGSTNVQGGFVVNGENVEKGYFSYNVKDARNIMFVGGEQGDESFSDVFIGGAVQGLHFHAVQGSGNSEHVYCSSIVVKSSNIYYSYGLQDCSYCLGCIGLKNKQFCLFNKQYTKEERYQKVDEIFSQMEQSGVLGKFFPGHINPFYFNDTVSSMMGNFTKEEVEKDGYLRRDEEIKVDIPSNVEVIDTKNLDIVNYDESILKKVIRDEKGNYYRIVKMEYEFLKKYDLPLPNLHWMDRLKLNFHLH